MDSIPIGHVSQRAAPRCDHVLAGQKEQLDEPDRSVNVPFEHGKHSAMDVPPSVALNVPTGQAEQLVEPSSGAKVPAGHNAQLETLTPPKFELYVPAGQ